jgi:hypothetical protein
MKVNTPALRMAEICDFDGLFNGDFHGKSWPELLVHFKNRRHVNYLPVSAGKIKHIELADNILKNVFEFNHERYQLAENFDWTVNPSKDIEWHILLHKFYYLKDLVGAYAYTRDECYPKKWMNLISTWVEQVPDGFIDSQVTGRRLQQWIASFNAFISEYRSPSVTPAFLETLIRSINSQAHYLCHHLTPEGNHRTLELYAIFLTAVTFPELELSAGFLEFSKTRLLENMRSDLLADGVHRELSTDYHHTVLKNYLRFRELAALNGFSLPEECDSLLKAAIEYSCYAHKPDGFIPAINDGDCNSYLGLLKKTLAYYPNDFVRFVSSQGRDGKPPLERSRVFAESGYIITRSEWAAEDYSDAKYLLFDCGKLGFGSHGHYDLMNIEMAAYGRSLIVDPGRYTYCDNTEEDINWRQYFKGTSGHNTVVVDGLDQIPYRGGRPIEAEPKAELIRFISTPDFDYVHGRAISHCYPAVHERMIYFAHPDYWLIADSLTTQEQHHYDLYFHLSREAQDHVQVESGEDCILINSPNLLIVGIHKPEVSVTIEQGYVSPEYGIKHKAPVIKFSQSQAANADFFTVLYPYRKNPPKLKLLQLPVTLNGHCCEQESACALKLEIQAEQGAYTDYLFINRGALKGEFQFGVISCNSHLLFVRVDESGKIVKLHGEELEFLKYRCHQLVDLAHRSVRLTYQRQTLAIAEGTNDAKTEIINLDENEMEAKGFDTQGIRQWFN